jgi:purine-nucleoside phosphorylase
VIDYKNEKEIHMNTVYEKLQKCYKSVREKVDFEPEVALILGSGLGDYADSINIHSVLDYNDIEGFPVSTVKGHKGRFVFGYIGDVPVVIMQGRVHYYEGYPITDVVLPTRLMKMMGAKVLFLTNAAGGVNFNYKSGDFMMITDHISDFVPSPLIGENIEELGLRFPDMSNVYDLDLQATIRNTAKESNIPLQEGVYLQFTGPNFETPHEVKMCRILGADAVGMSTACEAMAAKHMGMKVCGISCISNLCAGMTDQPLTHEEVQETADRVAPLFKQLITDSIKNIAMAL